MTPPSLNSYCSTRNCLLFRISSFYVFPNPCKNQGESGSGINNRERDVGFLKMDILPVITLRLAQANHGSDTKSIKDYLGQEHSVQSQIYQHQSGVVYMRPCKLLVDHSILQ